ncbi:hypothetical protein C6499_22760 [Candidatus Poribacteria bacterium]|nr:MAG: hypothetical protein C6499_22760 [Candidatus Poribacteria bacterium]
MIHRRAQIINALEGLFETLKTPVDESGFPIQVKTVQKRFVHWTALDQQDALPAILLTYGDNGSAPDSPVVGYIDENFPIAVTAVMKEEPHLKDLTDQASDMHYSIGRLINSNPTLGVEGVNPEKTRIVGWRGSEGTISKFEIIRFRLVVVHRYHATENV